MILPCRIQVSHPVIAYAQLNKRYEIVDVYKRQVSPLDMLLTFLLAFAMGLLIFFIYKKTYTGVMYSAGFGLSLIAMTLITTLVIMAISSNVVLSLGMVGALSICLLYTSRCV